MIELHTTATANGYKASIMLEECGLPYSVHDYDLVKGEHRTAGYLALNPVGRLPSIVDRDAGLEAPVFVYGTQAILLYLAERTGLFMPAAPAARAAVYTWLGFISSDLAPAYSGQFVFGVLMQEKLPPVIDYYQRLVDRMLAALETQLARTTWLAGDSYSIADILAYPVAATSARRYPGDLADYPQLARWAAMVGARPAVQRGMQVPR